MTSGRHRLHRFPGRRNTVKVLYDDDELTAVRQAAAAAGLRPAGFVATAAMSVATGQSALDRSHASGRQSLAELIQLRQAVVQASVELERVATLCGRGEASADSLEHALAVSLQALVHVDAAASLIARRLQ